MILRILCLGLLLAARPTWAALGGPPLPASAGPVAATPATTSAGIPYTKMHRTLADGVQLDEFVDARGNVFALSWSGPFKPDLQELLGTYFDGFRKAAEAQRSGSRAGLSLDGGGVAFRSGGHAGAFAGRAWMPDWLPAGFDTQGMK